MTYISPSIPVFNEALKREIDKIAAALPHDQIAIQFDVASAVFARLQRGDAECLRQDARRDAGDVLAHSD